jgi:multiple sugar transport system permease protein
MFPRPIQKASPVAQWVYTFALPVALLLWLFPLLGVALTSLRPAVDLAQGNYFGMPSGIAWENYVYIFTEHPHRPVHAELDLGDGAHGDRAVACR